MAMEKSYPCKDNLWAHCGALGEALRRASEAERRVEELEKANTRLTEFVRDCRDNWDCDKDGHRYNTGCRCCEAETILGKKVY